MNVKASGSIKEAILKCKILLFTFKKSVSGSKAYELFFNLIKVLYEYVQTFENTSKTEHFSKTELNWTNTSIILNIFIYVFIWLYWVLVVVYKIF